MRRSDHERPFRFPAGLNTPFEIQKYLNRMLYDDRPGTRSPRWVTAEKRANCFEGALFAAAALRRIGWRPLLVDLRAVNDDDHVLAVFKRDGLWGAVAKSNMTTLRFREPVYRTLRELVMSYFEGYINTIGEKTLRSYSRPLDLARFDRLGWETTDEDLSWIGERLDRMRHIPVISPREARRLQKSDRDLFKAAFLGSLKSGLYRAKRRKKPKPPAPRRR